MNNSTVLITGALTGIGRATALAFAREGARVVVSGRHEGQKLATELRQLGLRQNLLEQYKYTKPTVGHYLDLGVITVARDSAY